MLPSNPSPNGDSSAEDAGRAAMPENISPVTPDEAQAAENDDRRVSPRRKKLLRILVRDESSGEVFDGWIADRSLGGMCLTVSRPLEAGALLAVRRPTAPENTPWVEMRVRNVREYEKSWEVGCEYTHTPAWETLVQFE